MSFTPTYTRVGFTSASNPVVISVTIPAHSAVFVIANYTINAAPSGNGTLADSNSVAYTAGNFLNTAGDGWYFSTFYTLDSGSAATSLTYGSGGGSWYSGSLHIWVCSVTATPTLIGTVASEQLPALTGTDATTTGAFAITSTDGFVVGAAFSIDGSNVLTKGTGQTQDFIDTGPPGSALAQHIVASGSQASTFTSATDYATGIVGIAMQIASAVGIPVAWVHA